mgnify:CR=1 FL=1
MARRTPRCRTAGRTCSSLGASSPGPGLVSRDSLRKVEVVGEVAVGREFEGTRQVGLELLLLLRRQAHEVQPATFGLRLAHERAHVVGDVERAQRRIVRDGAGDAIELAHVEHAVLERDLRSVLLGKRVEVGEPERGIVAAERQEHVVDGGFIFQVQRSEFHGPAFRSIGCFAAEQIAQVGAASENAINLQREPRREGQSGQPHYQYGRFLPRF